MEEPLLVAETLERRNPPRTQHIHVSMEPLLEEYKSRRRKFSLRNCCSCNIGESISRCWNSTKFVLVLVTSAVISAAPEVLALAEILTMLVIYFSAIPNALWVRCPWSEVHYAFNQSVEDLVLIGVLRAITVFLEYKMLPKPRYQWQYLITAYIYAALSIPFAGVKTGAIAKNGLWDAKQRAPAVALCVLSIVFSIAHVAAAHGVVAWMRRRERLGLPSEGVRRARTSQRNLASQETSIDVTSLQASAIEAMTASDSQFFTRPCELTKTNLDIHYKIAKPPEAPQNISQQTGIILIHSFGGGEHSWRHVMQPLAEKTGAIVAAYDRPGFGLTTRPLVPRTGSTTTDSGGGTSIDAPSPYSLDYHAHLAVALAEHLNIQHVAFIGAGDGALVAVMAAERARRLAIEAGHGLGPVQEHHYSSPDRNTPEPSGGSDFQIDTDRYGGDSPSSYDLNWMGSAAKTGRREILKRLLRGSPIPPLSSVLQSPMTPSYNHVRNTSLTLDAESNDSSSHRGSHRRGHSAVSDSFGISDAIPEGSPPISFSYPLHPVVAGVVLIHPDVSGQCGPMHIRVLGTSKIGREVLRDLLSIEVGDVGYSRAWAGEHGPPPDVLSLYQKQLQVGPMWDAALVEVCRASGRKGKLSLRRLGILMEGAVGSLSFQGARGYNRNCNPVPLLVIHGAEDELLRVEAARSLVERAPRGQLEMLQGCGHLAYEEQPQALAGIVGRFLRDSFA